MFRTPLAWKNLTHEPRRLAIAVAGVAFAVILMFIELGFLNALLDSTVGILTHVDGEVLILSKSQYALTAGQRFRRDRLHLAASAPGVRSTAPLYMDTYFGLLRAGDTKQSPIRVFAVDLENSALRLDQLAIPSETLAPPRAALFDTRSRPFYNLPRLPSPQAPLPVELSGRRLDLVGTFELGTDFANDGNLVMSAANFRRYFPNRAGLEDPLSLVEMGVVRVEPGASPEQVRDTLRRLLPGDVLVYTRREFIGREKEFWSTNAPVGYIFTIGTIMGFVVGVIICYQIIYSDIADHMAEFATLRAMGYPAVYFVGVVLCEALYLSLLGFAPGFLISLLVYRQLAAVTGLLVLVTFPRVALVLVLTMLMCLASGLLAIRKVLLADPAELF